MVCTEFKCLSDRDSSHQIKGGSQYELRGSQAVCERMDSCNQIMPQIGAKVESLNPSLPADPTSGAQAHNLPGSVSVSSSFDFHAPNLRHPIHFTTHGRALPAHLSLLAYSIPQPPQ